METNQEKPEMPPPKPPAQPSSSRLWIPVVEAAEYGEQEAADQHVVKVRHDKIRVRQLPVERRDGQHHAGQACDQELEQESETEEHRILQANLAAIHPPQPVEDLDPCRDPYQHRRTAEE